MTHAPATNAQVGFGPWIALVLSVILTFLIPLAGMAALGVTAVYAHVRGAAVVRTLALGCFVLALVAVVLLGGAGVGVEGGLTD